MTLGFGIADLIEYLTLNMGGPIGHWSGTRSTPNANDDAATTRGINAENNSADALLNEYDVEQNPPDSTADFNLRKAGTTDPFVTYDNYAPDEGTSVRNIWSVCRDKIAAGQAQGIVINLDDSDVEFADLKQQFDTWPISGLDGVLVVKGNTVVQLK